MTATQLQEALNMIGWEPEIVYERVASAGEGKAAVAGQITATGGETIDVNGEIKIDLSIPLQWIRQ